MVIVKAYERLYNQDGKRKISLRKVRTNIIINGKPQVVQQEVLQSKMWFMDLNDDEEAMLRATYGFSFESVPYWDAEKISPNELEAGMKRLKEILY